jgi:hypothetical protein
MKMLMVGLLAGSLAANVMAQQYEVGHANPDGTHDSINLETGEYIQRRANPDGSYNERNLTTGDYGLGSANGDGSQDMIRFKGDERDRIR